MIYLMVAVVYIFEINENNRVRETAFFAWWLVPMGYFHFRFLQFLQFPSLPLLFSIFISLSPFSSISTCFFPESLSSHTAHSSDLPLPPTYHVSKCRQQSTIQTVSHVHWMASEHWTLLQPESLHCVLVCSFYLHRHICNSICSIV